MERRLVNRLEWLELDKVLSDSQEYLVSRPVGRYLTRSCGDFTEYTCRVTQPVFYAVVKIREYQVSSTVDPPCATSSHKLPQTQNNQYFPGQNPVGESCRERQPLMSNSDHFLE